MLTLLLHLLVLLGSLSPAREVVATKRVVYGIDDRLEPFEIENQTIRNFARSACGVMWKDSLIQQRDGSFNFRYFSNYTTGSGTACNAGLCHWVPFYGQPIGPWCSAFLVAPDLLVSAGHCVERASRLRFIFGFEMLDRTSPARTRGIPRENVYECSKIVGYSSSGTNDWAVFRLSRPVEGAREPLRLRRSGTPAAGTPLMTIGHPAGLPLKIDPGGNAKRVTSTTIGATLDTFGGNSGGMVVNLDTLEVEGILIQGNPDYSRAQNASCCVSNRCSENTGCSGQSGAGFEVVSRIQLVTQLITEAGSQEW